MKKELLLGLALVFAFGITSCKTKESAYKAAYEKAQEKPVVEEVPEETPVVKPVVKQLNASVRSEKIKGVSQSDANGLKAYSVVVGSFTNKTNATRLQEDLKADGYNAILAQNEKGMYRVIAASFDDKPSAADERDNLKSRYPGRFDDAWLLYNN